MTRFWRVVGSVSAVLTVAVGSGAGVAAASTAPPPDAWASEYAGAGSTGDDPGEHVVTAANASTLAARWTFTGGADFVAPAIVDGIAYHPVNPNGASGPSSLVATSVVTGATSWTTPLPANTHYLRGQTVVGDLVLLPFEGWHQLAGITAVDLRTHRVVWSRTRPPSTDTTQDDGTGAPLVTDGTTAYLVTGENVVSAFAVSTGRLLWHLQAPTWARGYAARAGLLVTSGPGGLVAYARADGHVVWTSRGGTYDDPVIAGPRVVAPDFASGVVAYRTTGCGTATCAPLWDTVLTNPAGQTPQPDGIEVGGADAATVFVTASFDDHTGRLYRLSATTGRVQWSAPLAYSPGAPVRAGDTVWLVSDADTLVGYSATATTGTPLRTIAEPQDRQGIVQGVAVADGTVAVMSWPNILTGYRVPGT